MAINNITGFLMKGCHHCETAKATLREAGLAFFDRKYRDDGGPIEHAAMYFSGQTSWPQVFVGSYSLGGSDELTELWKTRRLRDILNQVDPHATLGLDDVDDEELARGAEDVKLMSVVPKSDGTHSDDPEQWAILKLYKQFFGFWPNTFLYLHHWPEAYKQFVYCHNMAAIQQGKEVLSMPLLSAVAFATSNAHGCNYCQVHSASTGGDSSMKSVEQLKAARKHEADESNPFDEYWLSLADLAGMASLNEVPEGYLDRLRDLSAGSRHNADVENEIVAVAMVSGAFGFLNVFNDLVGLDIEGGWAGQSRESLGLEGGRHDVDGDSNPDNLSHELPSGRPDAKEMMGKYAKAVGKPTEYLQSRFGTVPTWLENFPKQAQPLHASLYSELMSDWDEGDLSPELKHLLAYVSHVEKRHEVPAATEAFIAHHVSDTPKQTVERLRNAFAIASGRGGDESVFSEVEAALLRMAYLSAKTPLVTPRRFAQPLMDQLDPKTLIEFFCVCGLAGLVQRFSAVLPPEPNQGVQDFMNQFGLETDSLKARFPLPAIGIAQSA